MGERAPILVADNVPQGISGRWHGTGPVGLHIQAMATLTLTVRNIDRHQNADAIVTEAVAVETGLAAA